MGKLVFYYGTMGSAKTANALMTRYQYIQNGRTVWLLKPAADTRDDKDGKTIIKSRIGLEAESAAVLEDDNIFNVFTEFWGYNIPDVIICDEAQFFSAEQVEQLRDIATFLKIDILCFGLKTNFMTYSFEGSKRLFELADELIKLENICDCGQPALVNARLDKFGNIVTAGENILIGGDESYKAMCWKCYRQQTENKLK
jgi:thymidine kinase